MYQRVIQQVLEAPGEKRALFCSTDEVALGCLKAALNLGVKIPENLGIVGYGKSGLPSPMRLTSVNQDYFGIGEAACRKLVHRLQTGEAAEGIEYRPTHLAVGETTIKKDL